MIWNHKRALAGAVCGAGTCSSAAAAPTDPEPAEAPPSLPPLRATPPAALHRKGARALRPGPAIGGSSRDVIAARRQQPRAPLLRGARRARAARAPSRPAAGPRCCPGGRPGPSLPAADSRSLFPFPATAPAAPRVRVGPAALR